MSKDMTVVRCNVIGKSRLWSPVKEWFLKWSLRLSHGMIKMPGAAVVVGAFSSTTSSGKPYAALAICMAYIFIWLAAVHVHMWLES